MFSLALLLLTLHLLSWYISHALAGGPFTVSHGKQEVTPYVEFSCNRPACHGAEVLFSHLQFCVALVDCICNFSCLFSVLTAVFLIFQSLFLLNQSVFLSQLSGHPCDLFLPVFFPPVEGLYTPLSLLDLSHWLKPFLFGIIFTFLKLSFFLTFMLCLSHFCLIWTHLIAFST